MSLAQIEKINLVYTKAHQEKILEFLQDKGFAQIEEVNNEITDDFLCLVKNGEELSGMDYKLAGIKFSLDFLTPYYKNSKKKSLNEKLNPKIFITQKDFEKIITDFDDGAMVKEVQELEGQVNQHTNNITGANQDIHLFTPWKNLSFIPNQSNLPEDFAFKLIIIDDSHREKLIHELNTQIPLSEIETVASEGKESRLAVIFYKKDETKLNEIFSSLGVKPVELPEIDNKVSEYISKKEKTIVVSNEKLVILEAKATKDGRHIEKLKIVYDYLSWQREKIINAQKMLQGGQLLSLVAWIDKTKRSELEEGLSQITKEFAISSVEIKEDEQVPVIFNNSWAKSFEAVTNVYGAPQYNEPDPTPYLAPFFILFFGLCLTDAGYGIILALISWLGIKFMKAEGGMLKMLKVLMYGGIVTFFLGALVGGWFGIVIDNITINWLRELLVGLRVLNPVEEPIKMLIFSLILGIIQVVTGVIISLIWKIRHNDIKSAIFDDAAWLFMIFAILIWSSTKIGIISLPGMHYLVILGVIILILTQGRSNKNPVLKIGLGVVSLYGLVNYLSDVLSYSRLLALGLATGIIAMVINLIAGLTIDMIPYVGWFIAVLILIGGHIFNIAINALGAFIHSARLQFVEFFPKFMEGGGRVFQPFEKQAQYIRIVKQEDK